MSVTAAALRELHRIHQQRAALRERLERGPKQIRARAASVAAAEEHLAKVQAEAKAARVLADQKQLLLKTGEAKIADLKVKLNQCSTNREYQALKDQIAADEMANSVLADEILEALEQIDEFKRLIGEAQQQVAKAKDELAKVQQAVHSEEASLQAELARLEAELKRAEQNLPADFRDAYDRVVKAKGQDAMAAVEGDSCGGCYQSITANMANDLTMARVVFCKNCGRLLYYPEDRAPGRGR
jgi:predicted  nucleic acid-binding Zn-ribbon protein